MATLTCATIAGSAFYDDHALPGTESQEVADRLEGAGDRALDTVTVVFRVEETSAGGVDESPEVVEALEAVRPLAGVRAVTPPSAAAFSVSEDATIGYATVTLETVPLETDADQVRAVIDTVREFDSDTLRVEVTGDAARGAIESGGGAAEGVGILAALVILVFLFGSFLAASLPVLSAVFAVGSSIALAVLVSHVTSIPSYAAPMMALVGLGVGIDYALLIFSRYRAELLAGRSRDEAAVIAQRTAGRSVAFAGATVIIALLGLIVLGLGSLRGLAIAVAVTVLATLLASATLLPALLTLFGRRLEASVKRREAKTSGVHGDRWRRLSDAVARRRWLSLTGGLLLLVLLCVPALSIRLGFADAGTDPADSTTRQGYDLLAEGFGAGSNGPLVVLADGPESAATAAREAIAGTNGVAEVVGPLPSGDPGSSTLLVFPESGPAAQDTIDLVETLRTQVLPDVGGGNFAVGGSTAAAIDFATAVADRMPWFVLVVVGISTLLLMVVFRSLLIPLKAAVLNLLSIGAALGVMQLVYGEGTLGQAAGPIEAFLPVIVFAVVFGLSMDYEVFLVSRMHEEWRHHGNAARAIREGLATTGAVITAAAAIMVVVFGSFMLSPDRMLGQMGLGLATAVFLDALVVRCLVVPAVMHLLGERAWWLPPWLENRLPHVRLEDPTLEPTLDDTPPTTAAAAPTS
ncbi:MAG: MMPL family transporter [Nocardioides sp.]|nr:MMPL family transporter [Nocardioides sp.]